MGFLGEEHRRAMDLVDEAESARREGKAERAHELYLQALDEEERAASRSENPADRSVLFRSAAWIALESDRPSKAAALAMEGLTSAPKGVLETELRDVLKAAADRLGPAADRRDRARKLSTA